MQLPLIDRKPTFAELEKLRLILSTYQDGSGQKIKTKAGNLLTIPDYRDFERAVALAFNGETTENKHVFDVRLTNSDDGLYYGISCKMKGELGKVKKNGTVYIELSNSSGKFRDAIRAIGIKEEGFEQHPKEIGIAVVELVKSWHNAVDVSNGGKFNSDRSVYLVLEYNPKTLVFQLFQFPLHLLNPYIVDWSAKGNVLKGKVNGAVIWDFYSTSGGQLKWYPPYSDATYISDPFELEPLPTNQQDSILEKVKAYFPEKWAIVEQAEKIK